MKKLGKRRIPKGLKVFLWVAFIIYLISGIIVSCSAVKNNERLHGWLYYSNGPYKGKVIELDTGNPIEGAVVARSWHLEVFPGWPKFCDAVETLTDKNGEFVLPRAWCINFWPIARLNDVGEEVVFKPGYLGYPPLGPSPEERRARMPKFTGQEFTIKKQYYVIELGRPETQEEKQFTLWGAEDILNFFDGYKKLPMLFELADKENKALGLGGLPYKKGGRK